MSRAFINEDAGGPERRYHLPKRDDPGFDAAAAWALIEVLAQAKAEGNERLEQLAERFLRVAPR